MNGIARLGTTMVTLVVAVVLLAVKAMWNGYVLTVLWGWFIAPTFGLSSLALAPAIGLWLVVVLLTGHRGFAKDNDDAEPPVCAKDVAHVLLGPAVFLGFGAVVHQFM